MKTLTALAGSILYVNAAAVQVTFSDSTMAIAGWSVTTDTTDVGGSYVRTTPGVGGFSADMLVEGVIMVENKAVQTLVAAHEVQLVNYLTATGIEIGLLLNFGAEKLQFKRKHRTHRPRQEAND